jgi:hypothetical protein
MEVKIGNLKRWPEPDAFTKLYLNDILQLVHKHIC